MTPPTATSLTRRSARSGELCPACGSVRLTELGMTLTDGSVVRFAFCHECEHKTWKQNGAALAFDSVLQKTRKHR